MNKKLIIGIVLVFVIGIGSLVAVTAYQYTKTKSVAKGPNYSTDVHAQLEAAIDAGDYDAWMKIRQDNNLPMHGKMFQLVTKENFATFVELHHAMESGDTAKADTLRQELGLGSETCPNAGNLAHTCTHAGVGLSTDTTTCSGAGSCQGSGSGSGSGTHTGGCARMQQSPTLTQTHTCGMMQ